MPACFLGGMARRDIWATVTKSIVIAAGPFIFTGVHD